MSRHVWRRLRALIEPARLTVFPPDPGGVRLVGALRATLGGVLTLLCGLLLARVTPMPFASRVMGFAVAMFLGVLVRDPTRRGQALTLALAPLPTFAVVALTAVALPQPYLPEALTLAVVFAAIAAASCGPRWAALGGAALIGLLVSLLSRVAPSDLPNRLLILVVAALCAAALRFGVLPDRPGALKRRFRGAVRRAMLDALAAIETALLQGRWHAAERRTLRRSVVRLNEAVMLAQPLLAPDAALHLLECDLMLERIARVALLDLGEPVQRPSALGLIAQLRHAVVTATPAPPPGLQSGRLPGVLAGLALLLDRPPIDAAAPAAIASPPIPAGRPWATLDIRPAVQATLATLLAILGGALVSRDRWFWAVFAALVLFQGTRSRGESVAKAVEMMLGTLAGVLIGLLAATLLQGHRTAEMATILGGVFLAFLASTAAYGVMVFWLTVVLGVLFGMLGYFPRSVLLLRLEETVVGAVAGILVASAVLARPTPNLVRTCAAAFLRALGPVVDQAARPLRNQPNEAVLPAMTLALEQRFQALRTAAQPLLPGTRVFGAERTRRLVLLVTACDAWARDLVRTSLHLPPRCDPAVARLAGQTLARIAASIAALAQTLEGKGGVGAALQTEPDAAAAVPEGENPTVHATRLLLRIDSALLHMRQRMAG